MKVILQADVKGQGKKGQAVEVSDGYARNFLLPRKLAIEADSAALNDIKGKEAAKAYRAEQELAAAQQIADQLRSIVVTLRAKGGTSGRIFGSITPKEIAETLKSAHRLEVDRRKIEMPDDNIKQFGSYELTVKLHPKVTGKLHVKVEQEQ